MHVRGPTRNRGRVAPVAADGRRWRAALGRVLEDPDQPSLVFQPIVDLHSGAVTGYEALARFPGPAQATPDQWFAAAARLGLGVRLEARVLRAAVRRLADLPPGCFLSVNCSPGVLVEPEVERVLRDAGDLSALVLELTEQTEVADWDRLLSALAAHRAAGLIVAVDDVGGQGYSGLHRLLRVRPDLIKLDRTIVSGADRDPARLLLARLLREWGEGVGAAVVVEGIERRAELEAFAGVGVQLGQGWLLGAGAPGWTEPLAPVVRRIRATAERHARTRGAG